MFFKDCIEKINSTKIKIYVDMDGVIADYIVGDPFHYDEKRPLFNNIKNLEEVSKMNNVEMFILSASRMNIGVSEKNKWLDIYAPFFKKENRNILPREEYDFKISSVDLKAKFVKNIERDGSQIVIIDDDCRVLKALKEQNLDIILYKDTVLVD